MNKRAMLAPRLFHLVHGTVLTRGHSAWRLLAVTAEEMLWVSNEQRAGVS